MDSAPGQRSVFGSEGAKSASASSAKVTVLLIAVTFLLVTIGLIALQPNPEPVAVPVVAAVPPPSPEPDAEPVQAEPVQTVGVAPPEPKPEAAPVVQQQVSRADASLLELQQSVRSTQASDVLRQLAATGRSGPDDLQLLARDVLGRFGYRVRDGDRLHALLVGALSNQKSNAYIDALLNTAAARGEFSPPIALLLPTGRMDTSSLLQGMVRAASN